MWLNTRGNIRDLAVSVRLVNEVPMSGTDVKGFWQALGFQHRHESIKSGLKFSIDMTPRPVLVSPKAS